MTTKKPAATELRRCTGSQRFGIEPHEAPIAEFPKQSSRKDGLGVMCAEHWRAYVKGLAAERKTKAIALLTDTGEAVPLSAAGARKVDAALARSAAKATRAAKPKAPRPRAHADAVAAAEKLIAQVNALPGPEHIARVGDPEVQAALELVGGQREMPLGETIDGGTEEADAA